MSAPEPTAEHKRTAARLIDAIYDRGTVDAIECKAAEGLIARALAAAEARGFERGRVAGPVPVAPPPPAVLALVLKTFSLSELGRLVMWHFPAAYPSFPERGPQVDAATFVLTSPQIPIVALLTQMAEDRPIRAGEFHAAIRSLEPR